MTADELRVAVVTGASSGLGLETAKELAARGWRVIGQGRNPERTALAENKIRAVAKAPFDMILADLALLADAARAADEIAALTHRVDVLVNNAGGVTAERKITSEGNEASFAGNHLGPFLLTKKLLPLLRTAAADAPAGATRIIVTSSSAHEVAPGLDWNDLQMINSFRATPAYCNVKLANILFARKLARLLWQDGIVSHAMHPGIVDTNFVSHGDAAMQSYFKTATLTTASDAADTLIWLATAEEPGFSTGGYYFERKVVPSAAAAQDDALADRLWDESERLIAKVTSRRRCN
jgi:NAD(P)-dependent dehydrogenase (short-subunit alcohol dehydrogenase family)